MSRSKKGGEKFENPLILEQEIHENAPKGW